MAGRRLRRNRPPGERGGVRLQQGIPGQGALFFLFFSSLLCSVFLALTQYYCQNGYPTRENPKWNISETNRVRLLSGGEGLGGWASAWFASNVIRVPP